MSASSNPTRAPSAARASARLTAVVLLPTPPLPEATAITFLTLGSSAMPRCTACAAMAAGGGDRGVARRRDLAFGRVAQFDIEGDVGAVDLEVLDRLRAGQRLARVGVDDGLQGLQ